jgi:hypothetical protein
LPAPSPPPRRLVFKAAVILITAIVWLACWQVAQAVFQFAVLRNDISLVYIPAGIRLVILLISGIWGAIGIALAFPFALLQVFPHVSWDEALTYSAIAGFIPYATILGFCRTARISHDLSTLRPIHLPVLSAAVSVTGGVAYTAALAAFGRFDPAQFLPDASAMVAGDFLGCFAVILLARLVIARRRKSR